MYHVKNAKTIFKFKKVKKKSPSADLNKNVYSMGVTSIILT